MVLFRGARLCFPFVNILIISSSSTSGLMVKSPLAMRGLRVRFPAGATHQFIFASNIRKSCNNDDNPLQVLKVLPFFSKISVLSYNANDQKMQCSIIHAKRLIFSWSRPAG